MKLDYMKVDKTVFALSARYFKLKIALIVTIKAR